MTSAAGGAPDARDTRDARDARSATLKTIGVIVAVSFALAILTLLPSRTDTILIGRPGDAPTVGRFYPPSDYLGAKGRWTRREGDIRLPGSTVPRNVTLRVASPEARVPDVVRITVVGEGRTYERSLPNRGWHDVDVPIDQRLARQGITLRVQSEVTADERGIGRGVFVERVVSTTGGFEALVRTRGATLLLLTLAWMGIVVCCRLMTGTNHSSRRRLIVSAGIILLAFAAVVFFRTLLMQRLALFAGLCVATVLVMAFSPSVSAPPLGRRGVMLFGAAAAVLVALLFAEALFKGHVLSQADMFYEHEPWRAHMPADYQAQERPPLKDVPMLVYPFTAYTQSRLRQGIMPLWTNAMSAGQPFLATYQSALLSPFTWVTTLVPLPHATVVVAALRLIVAGVGMFLFLRRLGLSGLASAFGGITFLLNPFLLVWLEHPLAGVPPWLPWMLLAAERLTTERLTAERATSSAPRRGLAMTMLALATALVLAGGHPHTGMFVAMFGGAYAIACALTSPDGRIRMLSWTVAGLALGVALVALQVLPFLEYVSLSRAAATRVDYPLNPFVAPASTLITAIVPNFLGHHAYGNFAGPTNYLEQQMYPGALTWLLAAAGLAACARTWRPWFFTASAAIAMLTMYGAPGVHELVSKLPLIKAASLPRAGIVALAALAVLAAFGADAILRMRVVEARARTLTSTLTGTLTLTITLIVTAIIITTLPILTFRTRLDWLDANGLGAFTWKWTFLAVWLTLAGAFVALARIWNAIEYKAAGVALCALAALDLLVFGRGFHPLIPPGQAFPVVPEIEHVQRDRDLFRVIGAAGALMPNAAMTYGLQDARGYDGLLVSRYADLLDAVFRYEHHTHFATGLHSPLLDLLNVKYVFGVPQIEAPPDRFTKVIDGEAPLWRNNHAFPRAFLVDGYSVMDGNPARRTLRDGRVDFRRVALLEQELPPELRPAAAATPEEIGRATITSYGDHRVEIDTDAPGPRLLVLTDVHYPGWVATVDGRDASMPRANFAFRAVPVAAGRHRVTFDYRPQSFRVGAWISASALMLLTIVVAIERRRAAPRDVRQSAPAPSVESTGLPT